MMQQRRCPSPNDDDAYDEEDSYQPPMRAPLCSSGDHIRERETHQIYKPKKPSSVVTASCRRQPQRTGSKVPLQYSASDPMGLSSNQDSDCSSSEDPRQLEVRQRHPNIPEDVNRNCDNVRLHHNQQQIGMYADQSSEPRVTIAVGKQPRCRQVQHQHQPMTEMQMQQQSRRPNIKQQVVSMSSGQKPIQRPRNVPIVQDYTPDQESESSCPDHQHHQLETGQIAPSGQRNAESQNALYGRSPTANGKQSRRQQQQQMMQHQHYMELQQQQQQQQKLKQPQQRQQAPKFNQQQQQQQQQQESAEFYRQHQRSTAAKLPAAEYPPNVSTSSNTKFNHVVQQQQMLASGDQGTDASFSDHHQQHQQHHTNSSNDFQQVVVSRLNLMLELVGCGQCDSCRCSQASSQQPLSCLAPVGSMLHHNQSATQQQQQQQQKHHHHQVIRASLPGCNGGGRPVMPTSVQPNAHRVKRPLPTGL
ncbi:hypothetical protein BOX15_Mlig017084g2 [Macrostomum lignano]|uniref:Uncharacterized protein n=1 Tax=Macrostomum lignano TaxID=282301 RepID=A0A267G6I9_9PLAT|nr:hypothetical protein BOX15_Mlig017084g2 [Macrostomum lignano]